VDGESSPVTVTDDTFDELVKGTDKPVLVDLWAPWCAPCRTQGPIIDDLAGEYAGRAVIAKLNVDENKTVPARYKVRGIPTILVFNGNELQNTLVGLQNRTVLKKTIDRLLEEKTQPEMKNDPR